MLKEHHNDTNESRPSDPSMKRYTLLTGSLLSFRLVYFCNRLTQKQSLGFCGYFILFCFRYQGTDVTSAPLTATILSHVQVTVGAPGVLSFWGEGRLIFRELGSTGNYFKEAEEQAQSFGFLGSPAKK